MANYSIKIVHPGFPDVTVTRKRFDAFQFQAHKAVYDVAEAQGLRDRPSAKEALSRVYAIGKGGLENIRIGSALIVLNT